MQPTVVNRSSAVPSPPKFAASTATRRAPSRDRRARDAADSRVLTPHAVDRRVRRRRRVLDSLPVISAEYAAGRLSYAKVRALTRFATSESDEHLASMGRHATGAQIEKLARAARRAQTGEEARGQYAAAYLKFTIADDGSVHGSFRLPPAEGAELMQALEAGAGRLPDYASEGEPAEQGDGAPSGWPLVAMHRCSQQWHGSTSTH